MANLDDDELSRHVSERSGTGGIEKIEDFSEWYQQKFPGRALNASLPPRMVLVGLGADERAQRMTKFLAGAGVEISLITFYGFRLEGQKLLARQIQIVGPGEKPSPTSVKQANEQAIQQLAEQLGIAQRLREVRLFLGRALPSSYEYPSKKTVGFYLSEPTESGNPTLRAYVAVYLNQRTPGRLYLLFYPRAIEAAGQAFARLQTAFANDKTEGGTYRFLIDSDSAWERLTDSLTDILSVVVMSVEKRDRQRSPG